MYYSTIIIDAKEISKDFYYLNFAMIINVNSENTTGVTISITIEYTNQFHRNFKSLMKKLENGKGTNH